MSQDGSTSASPALIKARAEFDDLVRDLRPELHRYCSRMTGSVVDGEDIVQDTLAKAYYALATTSRVSNLRSWLFRIAHNKAIDHLRRYDQRHSEPLDDHLGDHLLSTTHEPSLERRELTQLALSRFLELPPMQRSCVILKDVLDDSLSEIAELLEVSVGAVKAALHRGRSRLRKLSAEIGDARGSGIESRASSMPSSEMDLLGHYVAAFAARDFDTVRNLLANDVRLDLIGRSQRRGAAEVGGYFTNYDRLQDWHLALGTVEGRPAILVHDATEPEGEPRYFILIEWIDDRVALIRDYRYTRYVMQGADVASP